MTQVIPATDGSHAPVDLHALAASAGIAAEHVIPYGRDVAKIDLHALDPDDQPNDGASGAHYVVVTAITPTPFGEGKTTTAKAPKSVKTSKDASSDEPDTIFGEDAGGF